VTASGTRSIAAGGDITGIASTGDYATNVQQTIGQATVMPAEAFTPVTEVVAPPGVGNLPDRADLFVGRAQALAQLDAAFAGPATGDPATPSAGGAGVVVQAVHGLGGIGKSTLAARWARDRTGQYNPVWWITADSPAGIDAGLAALAVALQPVLAGWPGEVLRERAVQWLATHSRWLLILDNVTTPNDIRELLARASGGRYLITSRLATGWHGIAHPVRLDVLSPGEALDLLTRILTHDPAAAPDLDLEGLRAVCQELGYLPLAIEQAGAFMAQTTTKPTDYLDLLAAYPAAMYAAGGETADRSIARIWRITLDHLADTPLAGNLLRVLAWYAPDDIPSTLLTNLADPPSVAGALGRLAAYNMITVQAPTSTAAGTLGVHRLVQAVARTPTADDPHRTPTAIAAARDQATTALASALAGDWRDPAQWPTWRPLIAHVDALAAHTTPDVDTTTTTTLFNRAGAYLESQGAPTRAIALLDRALTDSRRILGDDHPDTLAATNNLAGAYQAAGNLTGAITLLEEAHLDMRQILGPDHPDTLTTTNNLALAYQAAGNLTRAIPLYVQTHADRRRILGDDHPDTLQSAVSLAWAYQAAGGLTRAIQLYEQTLTDRRRILGDDHPDTLTSANNLALAYQAAEDLARAIPLFEQTLADRQRVLGQDHPQTLTSANNLALSYKSAGDLTRAIPLYEQTLADSARVLGEDHPDTKIVRGNLAAARQQPQ